MSRLTTISPPISAIGNLPPFNFRDMGGWHLLTNDWGKFAMLEEIDFRRYLEGRIIPPDPLWNELKEKGFIRDQINFEALAKASVKKNEFHRQSGPSLHMIVVTLRCNQKCLYCHSSVVDPSRTDTDMDVATARRVVDFIFDTPNPTICIEFQGGEPLINWPIVKFIIEYAHKKNSIVKKKLLIALVSNLTLMTESRLSFLLDHHVSICTSLDGPPHVHNRNRPFLGGGEAQNKVVHWLKTIREKCEARSDKKYYLPAALMTTTRFSIPHYKEIIDLYMEMGLGQIFLRSLNPIGYAKRVWHEIGYGPHEFVDFYAKALDYIIELNLSGKPVVERMALVILTKIIKGEDPGQVDFRSPAGAVLGALAYNYDGGIFVSDEGRMVAHQGDDMFQVGHVSRNSWEDVLEHPTTKACLTATILDNQPMCFQCVYKPYCGLCPVFHYETQGNIFGHMPSSAWCTSHMGIFDVVFNRLREPKSRAVFEDWIEKDKCHWQEEGGAPIEAPMAGRISA